MTNPPNDAASEYRRYAEAFQDWSVAEAYRHRPPYPAEVFDILAGLVNGEPRHILDVGCGRGEIARGLAGRVARVDAVDFSARMIELGKRLPNGQHPHLHWLHGRVEDIALDPPYGLVTAGESIHWMDWSVVMPRFHHMLTAGSFLALVGHRSIPDPWSVLGDIIPRYRTDRYLYQPRDEREQGMFRQVGERLTRPYTFVQSIDDYVESYHSRAGFSRERMGRARADAFDRESRRLLLQSHPDGTITLQVAGHVVWGYPLAL
jgi:SAM-dependent methyltransferase